MRRALLALAAASALAAPASESKAELHDCALLANAAKAARSAELPEAPGLAVDAVVGLSDDPDHSGWHVMSHFMGKHFDWEPIWTWSTGTLNDRLDWMKGCAASSEDWAQPGMESITNGRVAHLSAAPDHIRRFHGLARTARSAQQDARARADELIALEPSYASVEQQLAGLEEIEKRAAEIGTAFLDPIRDDLTEAAHTIALNKAEADVYDVGEDPTVEAVVQARAHMKRWRALARRVFEAGGDIRADYAHGNAYSDAFMRVLNALRARYEAKVSAADTPQERARTALAIIERPDADLQRLRRDIPDMSDAMQEWLADRYGERVTEFQRHLCREQITNAQVKARKDEPILTTMQGVDDLAFLICVLAAQGLDVELQEQRLTMTPLFPLVGFQDMPADAPFRPFDVMTIDLVRTDAGAWGKVALDGDQVIGSPEAWQSQLGALYHIDPDLLRD